MDAGIYKITSFCMAVMLWLSAAAQQPSVLKFEESRYDFGDIREEDGRKIHIFNFRNTGSEPVVIISASTTCGCTVPTFSRKPVMPSQQGSIEVSFDPADRPGFFEKKIVVTTSEGGEPVRLFVSGRVLPRKKSVDELYSVYAGEGLRLETCFHSFAYVEHGKRVQTSIGAVNTSKRPLRFELVNESASGVFSASLSPDGTFPVTLDAGGSADITVSAWLPEESRVYGTVTERFAVKVNGRRSDIGLTVTGIAVDNRDEREDNSAPKAEINKNIVKFGVVKRGGSRRTESFDLVNTGDAPLMIRAVEGCGSGLSVSLLAGDSVAAGERRRVDVTVEPSVRGSGPSVEHLRIVTDDPVRPLRDVKVTMMVE